MISQVKDKVKKFLKETVGVEGGVKVIAIEKEGDGWVAEAEVAEMNQYLAAIKPEYRVFEKEHYIIRLSADLEVSSYKRGRISEEEKEV